jgi:geranylgeranyl transferase type-2 subunit beta
MAPPALLGELHVAFVRRSADERGSMEAVASEHLRLSGVYWGLACCALLRAPGDALGDAKALAAWVRSCGVRSGAEGKALGFAPAPGHDAHLLYTLSALQVLALLGELGDVDADAVAAYVAGTSTSEEGLHDDTAPRSHPLLAQIAGLQRCDGSFAGDASGEVDTRFSYCALAACALLCRLPALDVPRAAAFVRSCANFDGGFGATPGGESHAGQIFTALGAPSFATTRKARQVSSLTHPFPCSGALAIAGELPTGAAADRLGAWLAARQLACGGLCGRPEKAPDVCYSWWVLSSLAMLRRSRWLCRSALRAFILRCQDGSKGGISDRPDDEADVFHTFFGVAGLALMGHPGLEEMDPVFALPRRLTRSLGLNHADSCDSGRAAFGDSDSDDEAAAAGA